VPVSGVRPRSARGTVSVRVKDELDDPATAKVEHVRSLAVDGCTAGFAATAWLGEKEYAALIKLAELILHVCSAARRPCCSYPRP
jgi:hypothetical protein